MPLSCWRIMRKCLYLKGINSWGMWTRKYLSPSPGCLSLQSYLQSLLSSPRDDIAWAVTGRRCPHSGVGQDFLPRRTCPLMKTAVIGKQKFAKLIRRCQNDRTVDKNRGPIAKNRFSGQNQNFWGKKNSLLVSNHVLATTGQCCTKKKVPFSKMINSYYPF